MVLEQECLPRQAEQYFQIEEKRVGRFCQPN